MRFSRSLIKKGSFLLINYALIMVFFVSLIYAKEDLRVYQHGIDFVPRADGHYWLIWASSGNPPTGETNDGSWIHDIYYSEIDPSNPVITPVTIISNDEAQEPASSAAADNGNIMITNEDGWQASNWIAQRYGVYDNNLNDVKPYPNMVLDGGHSGHVAAVANRFVVFYSEGWVDGGGVDNLGSGDDVMLKVYNSNGEYEREKNISVGDTYRDWWPLVAGSASHALLLWQRFVDGQEYADLMYAIYNPSNGNIVKGNTKLTQKVKYYTYDVQYIPSINRFLIIGTYYNGGGFSFLIDESGNKTAQSDSIPEIVREAQPAVKNRDSLAYAVYPMRPNGAAVLRLYPNGVELNNTISDSYNWSYIGTDGIFIAENTVYFVSLSKKGYVEKTFTNVISAINPDKDKKKHVSHSYKLNQNYPNPFNPQTTISFSLQHKAFVSIKIYDINGNFVDSLVNEERMPGDYEYPFNAQGLSSGLYYYQLQINGYPAEAKKMLLVR